MIKKIDKNVILKSQDGWSAVFFYDPIALFFMPIICRLLPKTTPNQITLASLLFAIAAIFLVINNLFVAAAIFVQFGCILDAIDGKWARHTKIFSKHGAQFDAGVDFVSQTIVCIIAAYILFEQSWLYSLCFVCIALGTGRIHIKSIFQRHIPGKNLDLTPFASLDWYEFCQKRRLLARPISELDVAFVFPSLLMLGAGLGFGPYPVVVLMGLFILIRLVSRTVLES